MTVSSSGAPTQLQRALIAVEKAHERIQALELLRTEPIAVVGMGCRFPAGGNDPESFWRALCSGADGIREIPETRWPKAVLDGKYPGTRWAGLVDDVDKFDAGFFGIAPREAATLDPQQRFLLEVTWEALEDAGIVPASLMGSATGVFVGISTHDYQDHVALSAEDERDMYSLTGIMNSNAAGRLCFVLGLQGPAVALDTACSSSLVALHLACQSLRSGESTIGLAGGVNLILAPGSMAAIASTQALASDGRCRAFDAEAKGFVRGEGCGVVVLKRLSDAQREQNRIYAVIRGSAVNQDGRSTGLTTPNVLAQQALLRQALANAQLAPHEIGYVETHGTGTSLGDPVEYEGLREVLGAPRPDGSTCVLGALKTNLGHLEAAAGIAGFIKAALALQHEEIPPNLHFRTLNPHMSLEGTPFELATRRIPWPAGRTPRRAGVSSFGMSGTNAHVVLEEAPREAARPVTATSAASLFVVSSPSAEGLRLEAENAAAHFASPGAHALESIAYTAGVGRSHHEHRLAVAADSTSGLVESLRAFLNDESCPGLSHGRRERPSKIAFVFPGQGGQWPGMGRALLEEEGVFRETIDECERGMRALIDWSLSDVLRGEGTEAELQRVDVIQPAVFAMQVGLAAVWRSWGVVPAAVVGHSLGEVAGACVAGGLSIDDACRIICVRSRLVRRVSGQGGMAVVDLPADEVRAELRDGLSIAAVNGPRTTVVSGARAALAQLLALFEARGVFCRWVNVDYASHSPQMDALKVDLLAQLRDVHSQSATIPLYSTVTGEQLDAPLSIGYWQDNLRDPVQFWPAVGAMARDGINTFVEINPHPILLPSIADGLASARPRIDVVPSLRRGDGGRAAMLGSLGELYASGYDVDFARLFAGRCTMVSLPRHAWQRERHWAEPGRSRPRAERPGHAWLGPRYLGAERGSYVWQGDLTLDEGSHLREHVVDSAPVVAGAIWLEAALHVAKEQGLAGLEGVEFVQVLALSDTAATTVQVATTGSSFEVRSAPASDAGGWTTHARGRMVAAAAAPAADPSILDQSRARCPHELAAVQFYEQVHDRGLHYGERFAALERLWLGAREAIGELVVKGPEPQRWVQEPWVLDACLQVLGGTIEQDGATYLPVGVGAVRIFARLLDRGWVHATQSRAAGAEIEGDVRLYDGTGQLIFEALGVRLLKVREARLDQRLFQIEWEAQNRARLAPQPRREGTSTWLVLGDGALADGVVERLQASGARCVVSRKSESLKIPHEVTGVVHLWAAEDESPRGDTLSSTEIMNAQRWGCGSALALVKALTEAALKKMPRLFLVTRATQALAPETAVSVAHAPLWGLARTLAHEHPELRCACVDLPDAFVSADVDALCDELLDPGPERELAWRNQQRFVGRLARVAAPRASGELALSARATYLVSGGLGALGLEVARALARRGARHLLLIGRTDAGAAARQAITELAGEGVEVRVALADVSLADQLSSVLRSVPEGAPVRGVVHAAGVLDDATLLHADWSQFEKVFAPKLAGAWNLHVATRELPLDFFVMFSSAAAVLGSPGQANYAAANAFLDALAHHRRAAGLPALSIDWGAWSEVGLAAARADRGARLAAQGLRGLSPAQGIAAFDALIASDLVQIAVCHLDLPRWRASYPHVAELPFFASLMSTAGGASSPAGARAAIRRELEGLELLQRRLRLEHYLGTEMARVLRLPASKIHGSTPIASLGFDSLMALEFRNRAEVALDLSLPASLLWTYRTVEALASHLAERMGLSLEEPVGIETARFERRRANGNGHSAADTRVDEISEEDAEAALLARLDVLEGNAK